MNLVTLNEREEALLKRIIAERERIAWEALAQGTL